MKARFTLASVSTALTLLGVVIYGASYLAALSFCEGFGLTPEDIGWSNVRVLGRSALLAAIAAPAAIIASFAVVWIWTKIQATTRAITESRGMGDALVRWLVARRVAFLMGLTLVCSLSVAYLLAIVHEKSRSAADAFYERDFADEAVILPWLAGVNPILGMGTWTQPDAEGSPLRIESPVILLGQADGTSILFDLCELAVIHVPTEGLHLTHHAKDNRTLDERLNPSSDEDDERALRAYCSRVKRR